MHVIIPTFCVSDNSPEKYPKLIDITIKFRNCRQQNLKKSTVYLSEPGLCCFSYFSVFHRLLYKLLFPLTVLIHLHEVYVCLHLKIDYLNLYLVFLIFQKTVLDRKFVILLK